jgi:hypothetical protein
MSLRKSVIYFKILLLCLLTTSAFGQRLFTDSTSRLGEIWIRGQLTYSFNGAWRGATNMDYRFVTDGEVQRSVQSYTQDVIYLLNPSIELVGALRLFHTSNNDDSNNELRAALGLKLDLLSSGRFTIRNYSRYESRYFYFEDESLNGNAGRLRNRLFGSIALNKPRPFENNTLLFRWGLELFGEKGLLDDQSIISRYRIESGFGYRVNDSWNLRLVYMLQNSRTAKDNDFDIKEGILFLRTNYTIVSRKQSDG